MKKTVLYFSPTGGTAQVAKHIASECGIEAIDITVFDCEMSFTNEDMVFICFPVYGGRIPSPMYRRLGNINGCGACAVEVAVYGNRAVDDALLEMSELTTKHGFKTVAGCEMIAPHSVDKHIAADRPDASDLAKLNSFLRELDAKQTLSEVTLPGNHNYRKYEGLPFRPSSGKDCTGCGTCSAECPTGAIDPGDPQQPDKTKCISCMRCVSVCPFEAKKLPVAAKLAAAVSLRKLCAGRKEPKFYL